MKYRNMEWRMALPWAAAIVLSLVFFPLRAGAKENFPEKAVTLIVDSGAGGGTDVFARTIQPFAAKYLGVQLIVKNVPGGSGIVGNTAIYKAPPDGYTIGTFNLPRTPIVALMFKPPYEIEKFTPIATWATMPMVLAVHADAFQNFHQFVETARKRKISLATDVGSTGWSNAVSMERALGFETEKVPYPETGEMPVAVAGKHVDATVMSSQAIASFVKAGQIRPLIAFYHQRDLLYPDVPTAQELGYKFPVFAINRGVVGPPQIPAPIVKILEAAFLKAAQDPEFVAMSKKRNILVEPLSAEAYGQRIKTETEQIKQFSHLLPKKKK